MGAWDQTLFLKVLLSPVMLWAAWTTVWVATVAQAAGTAIGFAVAPLMTARSRPPRFVAFLYLWLFRGTPLLAQILFFYAVLPQLGLRLGVVATGLVALAVNEGARMAEVVRSGLLSVPHEQREAAAALGLRRRHVFGLVVLPQALRAILPPLGNNYSYMIKATSLLSAISFTELLRVSQQLAQSTARPLEIYAAASLYYLAVITAVTLGQRLIELRLRGAVPARRVGARRRASPAAPVPAPSADPEVVVEARGVSKRLGAVQAVDRVDLVVRRGEVVVIMGPSGSGKSTLLRCLNHLERPDEGVVFVEGRPLGVAPGRDGRARPVAERSLDRQRRRVTMVFQRFHLFAHLTALDNVALGPRRLDGLSWGEARERARPLLVRLGLADQAGQRPAGLSGGQRQRVAIARALVTEPSVLLLDEPTSALDPESVHEVLVAMRDLAGEGRTMIIVTHEIGFARSVADRIVVMAEGRITADGSPETILGASRVDPAQVRLAD